MNRRSPLYRTLQTLADHSLDLPFYATCALVLGAFGLVGDHIYTALRQHRARLTPSPVNTLERSVEHVDSLPRNIFFHRPSPVREEQQPASKEDLSPSRYIK